MLASLVPAGRQLTIHPSICPTFYDATTDKQLTDNYNSLIQQRPPAEQHNSTEHPIADWLSQAERTPLTAPDGL